MHGVINKTSIFIIICALGIPTEWCIVSEGSDQSVYLCSLMEAFAVRLRPTRIKAICKKIITNQT